MIKMRKILIFSFSLIMLCAFNIACAADMKVGVVDLKKVFTEAPQVASMRAKLQGQFDPKGKELQALKKDYDANVDKLNKNGSVMKDQEKKDLQAKINDQQNKLQTMQMDFQKSVITAENQSMQTVSKQIQDAVDSIAKQKGLNLVIIKGAVAYNDPSFDVTDDVLKILKK
jgi:outer membrane protein